MADRVEWETTWENADRVVHRAKPFSVAAAANWVANYPKVPPGFVRTESHTVVSRDGLTAEMTLVDERVSFDPPAAEPVIVGG